MGVFVFDSCDGDDVAERDVPGRCREAVGEEIECVAVKRSCVWPFDDFKHNVYATGMNEHCPQWKLEVLCQVGFSFVGVKADACGCHEGPDNDEAEHLSQAA